jgi:hypothetical protein
MDGTTKCEGYKVETYNYGDDFQLLTRKEKRDILKNAKFLLRLQRDNGGLIAVNAEPQKEKDNNVCVLRQIIL